MLQYFLYPEYPEQVEEVKAGTLARRKNFKAFPLRQWKNSNTRLLDVATITDNVNAHSPQSAFYSLSASEACLSVYYRLTCCLLTSLAELEPS